MILSRFACWCLAATLLVGCSGKAPTRKHIDQLRTVLQRLETAVQNRNRAAIDSLLSIQILDYHQNSDSLLRFVYGPDDSQAFKRFGLGEISYTESKARIDCFMMDSTAQRDRPCVLTLVYEHGLWLLKHFEAGSASGQDTLSP